MHAVDGDELLGQRVGRRVMVRRATRDAMDDLFVGQSAGDRMQLFAADPPPVGGHGNFRRRMGNDRGRPLDRMDLGEQRGVDESRAVEQIVV